MSGIGGSSGPLPVPVFRPSLDEMSDFSAFIARIERKCLVGAALVHPPAGWRPRANMDYNDLDKIQITRPIQQEILGNRGVFLTVYVEKQRRTVAEFRREAEAFRKRTKAPVLSVGQEDELLKPEVLDEIDRAFWKNLLFRRPTYGADQQATAFDNECQHFNLNKLDTILNVIDNPKAQIPGVHTTYLYFGMWGALFAFHCEDADLYSINYLHIGAPKMWYVIPPEHRDRFEELCQKSYPDHFRSCDQFMRHKQTLLSTDFLRKNGIPYGRVAQTAGTFMIVFPGCYHAGYSLGFNVGEAVNFASLRWLPMGRRAKRCECREDSVNVDVEAMFRALFPGSATQQFAEYVQRNVAKAMLIREAKRKEAGILQKGAPVRRKKRGRPPKQRLMSAGNTSVGSKEASGVPSPGSLRDVDGNGREQNAISRDASMQTSGDRSELQARSVEGKLGEPKTENGLANKIGGTEEEVVIQEDDKMQTESMKHSDVHSVMQANQPKTELLGSGVEKQEAGQLLEGIQVTCGVSKVEACTFSTEHVQAAANVKKKSVSISTQSLSPKHQEMQTENPLHVELHRGLPCGTNRNAPEDESGNGFTESEAGQSRARTQEMSPRIESAVGNADAAGEEEEQGPMGVDMVGAGRAAETWHEEDGHGRSIRGSGETGGSADLNFADRNEICGNLQTVRPISVDRVFIGAQNRDSDSILKQNSYNLKAHPKLSPEINMSSSSPTSHNMHVEAVHPPPFSATPDHQPLYQRHQPSTSSPLAALSADAQEGVPSTIPKLVTEKPSIVPRDLQSSKKRQRTKTEADQRPIDQYQPMSNVSDYAADQHLMLPEKRPLPVDDAPQDAALPIVDTETPKPKKRRNWAPIAVVPMIKVTVPQGLSDDELAEFKANYQSMCAMEEQVFMISTLLSLVKFVLRDHADLKKIAALGRRLSKTRKRFLNVQRGMFDVYHEMAPPPPPALSGTSNDPQCLLLATTETSTLGQGPAQTPTREKDRIHATSQPMATENIPAHSDPVPNAPTHNDPSQNVTQPQEHNQEPRMVTPVPQLPNVSHSLPAHSSPLDADTHELNIAYPNAGVGSDMQGNDHSDQQWLSSPPIATEQTDVMAKMTGAPLHHQYRGSDFSPVTPSTSHRSVLGVTHNNFNQVAITPPSAVASPWEASSYSTSATHPMHSQDQQMHGMLRFFPPPRMPSPSVPSPGMPSPSMPSPSMPSPRLRSPRMPSPGMPSPSLAPGMPFPDAMNNLSHNPMHNLALAASSFSHVLPGSFDPNQGMASSASPSLLAQSRDVLGHLPISFDKHDFLQLDPTSWQPQHTDRAPLSRGGNNNSADPNVSFDPHAMLPFEGNNGSASNTPNFDASEGGLGIQQPNTADATQDLFTSHLSGSGLFGVSTGAMCSTQGITGSRPIEREAVVEPVNLGTLGTWPQAG